MTVKTLSLPCPTCKKIVQMIPQFPFRPFCSERCKLIDLGEWASESRRIPSESMEEEEWGDDGNS